MKMEKAAELGWTAPHHAPARDDATAGRRRSPRSAPSTTTRASTRCSCSTRRRPRSTSTPRCSRSTPTRTSTGCTRSTWAGWRSSMPGPGAVHARRHRGAARATTRSRSSGHEVCILGRGITLGRPLGPPAVAEAPDRQRGRHRGAHRCARLARATRGGPTSSSPPPASPASSSPSTSRPGVVVVGGGVRYEGRKLLPDVDESLRGGRGLRSRPASAGSARPRSRCCSATRSRPPSAPPTADCRAEPCERERAGCPGEERAAEGGSVSPVRGAGRARRRALS